MLVYLRWYPADLENLLSKLGIAWEKELGGSEYLAISDIDGALLKSHLGTIRAKLGGDWAGTPASNIVLVSGTRTIELQFRNSMQEPMVNKLYHPYDEERGWIEQSRGTVTFLYYTDGPHYSPYAEWVSGMGSAVYAIE